MRLLLSHVAVFYCMYLPYVHNPGSKRKIFRTRLTLRLRGVHGIFYGLDGIWWSPGYFAMVTLDSEIVVNVMKEKKTAADSNDEGKTWIHKRPVWL